MGGRSATPEAIEKWRRHLKFVEELRGDDGKAKYSNEVIAKKMGTTPTYLSSCKSPHGNNPGQDLIDSFYAEFKNELPPDEYEQPGDAPKAGDPKQDYRKKENEFLREELSKATSSLSTQISNTEKTLLIFQTLIEKIK